jgi:hypothetical protein
VIRVIKTYAWIQATADSRIVKIEGAGIKIILLWKEISINAFPKRDIRRWPAIIFAVRRTHRVIGRIMFLVSSIKTMKFIKAQGVP